MEKIKIYYGVQGNGFTFELALRDYRTIKSNYPNAQPSQAIFVEYDMKSNFERAHGHLEKYIFPALVGFYNEEDLKKIRLVEFIKMPENQLTYKIEQNDESQIQPLSR
jgi:hypothetical protein